MIYISCYPWRIGSKTSWVIKFMNASVPYLKWCHICIKPWTSFQVLKSSLGIYSTSDNANSISTVVLYCLRNENVMGEKPLHIPVGLILISSLRWELTYQRVWHSQAGILDCSEGTRSGSAASIYAALLPDCGCDVINCFQILPPVILHRNGWYSWTEREFPSPLSDFSECFISVTRKEIDKRQEKRCLYMLNTNKKYF